MFQKNSYQSLFALAIIFMASVLFISWPFFVSAQAWDAKTQVPVSFDFESIHNPLGSVDVPLLLGRPVNLIFLLIGSLALLMYIYAGFTWMTAAGNTKKVETAQKILIWTSASLIMSGLAYVFVRFIFELLGKG